VRNNIQGKQMDVSKLSDEEVYELAEPIWENMRKGSNNVDYETFSCFFSASLKGRVNKERFENQCKEFPLLTSLGAATPVACIRRKEGVTVIFRQLSTRLEGEFVGQLTLAGTHEKNKVINAQVY
jgi:hypothetical protein